ncbi:unnamed protein product [Adineta ricciae]|uniref:Uncharacterized protein n=1 Tax=Adineta ricciae TaxID=249248 RepID=A0A813P054_ADIRI|nr:unnamed protein product [Adineta ricciae]
MSNYQGRKSEYTPTVYTRYFERTETPKQSNGHIYFDEEHDEKTSNYQTKRDLIFKRLFPSKYAQSSNEQSEADKSESKKTNTLSNNDAAQPLGDFIPLSSSKKQATSEADITLSSSDELNDDDDVSVEAQLPTVAHESIIGHVHPRTTIENVRAILIREFYQRTSDSHTEWLKCKMELPREYINPKYYADFQRRYRKDIQRNASDKKKLNSTKTKTDNGYHAFNLTKTNKITKEIAVKSENEEIIETSASVESKSPPEFIVLDTDDDDNDNLDSTTNTSYFIDRSSTSFANAFQPTTDTSNNDYREEDSKYAQLPSRTTSSLTVIRPILSKHQRRRQNQTKPSTKPLVSAIDRIIDHMDQSKTLNDSHTVEEQNLLIKQAKKRKKKKKKSASAS